MGLLGGVLGGVGGFLVGGPAGAAAGYSIGSSLGGKKSATGGAQGKLNQAADLYGGYATQDRNRYLQALGGGQDALDTYARSAVSSALPQFQGQLQGLRESAARRGISGGDLSTSYEGDLASAFDRNLTNAIAGQSMNLYGQQLAGYGNLANNSSNTYLDLLSGNRDAGIAEQNNRNSLWGSVIGAAGTLGGAYLGRRS